LYFAQPLADVVKQQTKLAGIVAYFIALILCDYNNLWQFYATKGDETRALAAAVAAGGTSDCTTPRWNRCRDLRQRNPQAKDGLALCWLSQEKKKIKPSPPGGHNGG